MAWITDSLPISIELATALAWIAVASYLLLQRTFVFQKSSTFIKTYYPNQSSTSKKFTQR
jgi:hypothetical protein